MYIDRNHDNSVGGKDLIFEILLGMQWVSMNTNQQKETIDHIIEQALLEDLQQTGDITSEAIFSDQTRLAP